MTNATPEAVQMRAARIAGAMYLITMATAIFGESFAKARLMVSGDATRTAQNIIEHELLFRSGIASDVVTFAGVVVLTWALYVLLRPVDRNIALLAAFWRLAEAVVLCTMTVGSLTVLKLLSGADYLTTYSGGQLDSLALLALSARGAGYSVGFVLLGLGSAAFSYLLLRSGYVPRALAAWGVVASLFLTVSSLWVILFPGTANVPELASYGAMGIFEVTLGFWLLIKGAKLQPSPATAA